MRSKKTYNIAIIFLVLLLAGCGGLRYSEVSPDAANFHPKTIAVLPADVTIFPETEGIVDRLFVEVLNERKWFTTINGGQEIVELLGKDEIFRNAVTEYLAKRANVSFSDPELSRKIGSFTKSEAFLIPHVDYWNYTTEGDKKVAKAGISITMVEAATGKTVWNATHSIAKEYLVFKPDISKIAKDLIYEMIAMMPH
jgi:hypothetical protein